MTVSRPRWSARRSRAVRAQVCAFLSGAAVVLAGSSSAWAQDADEPIDIDSMPEPSAEGAEDREQAGADEDEDAERRGGGRR